MKPIYALTIAVAVALAAAATASPAPPRLIGTVGPGFTISLKQKGRLVKTLRAGRYIFVVSDRASIHNFRLKGPGVNRAITAIQFTGPRVVTLTLRKGTYTYVCDVHPSMVGHFKVT